MTNATRVAELLARRFGGRVTERTVADACRVLAPRSRGHAVYRYIVSTSVRAVRVCRLCGRKTSWCTRYRRPFVSEAAETRHTQEELAALARLIPVVQAEIDRHRRAMRVRDDPFRPPSWDQLDLVGFILG